MNFISTPLKAEGVCDAVARFRVLAAETRAKLELALVTTDFPTTLESASQQLDSLARYEAQIEHGPNAESDAIEGLRHFGRNAYGPLIDSILRSAKFHGKCWRVRFDTVRAASRAEFNVGEKL